MSGKKISEMTAITGAQLDQTNDVLPVLDVSDTTNPNKKISIQELASVIGASGTTNVDLSLDGSNNLTLTDSDSNTVTVDLSSLDNSSLTLADVTANGAVTGENININAGLSVFADGGGLNDSFRVVTHLFLFRDENEDNVWTFDQNEHRFSTNGSVALVVDSSGKIGLSTTSPAVTLDIQGTDAVQLTSGTTAQRPTAAAGMIRFNSTTSKFEGYDGTSWIDLN